MTVTEFTVLDLDRVDGVENPANGANFLLLKSEQAVLSEDGMVKYVSADARRRMADSGAAMPNGDFPIPDEGHLRSAIGRLGNYKGDKAKAKAHIITRARALGLTHLLPEDWNVAKAGDMTQTDANTRGGRGEGGGQEGGAPPSEPYDQPRPPEDDGAGDSAPDKALPTGTALAQTSALAAEEASRAGKAAGDAAWEQVDAGLADQAASLLTQALKLITKLGARERAEGATAKGALFYTPAAAAAARAAIEEILRGLTATTDTRKGLEDMTKDELLKLLDERDAARQAKKAKKAAKRATVAGSTEGQDPAAEDAAASKAAEQTGTVDLAAQIAEAVKAAIEPLSARLANVEGQPARPTPLANATGITGGSGPRGAGDSQSPFAPLEKALADEKDPRRRKLLGAELLKAKMMAAERVRQANPAGPGVPVGLLNRPGASDAAADAAALGATLS